MRKLILTLLLGIITFSTNLLAKEQEKKYSMRVAYGYASERDLGDILLTLNFSKHPVDLTTVAIDGGYLLYSGLFGMNFDLYAKGGLSYFNEYHHADTYEALAYVKLLYNWDFADNRVRFGFGEGVSYVKDKLEAELIDAGVEGPQQIASPDPTAKFLNYLDITVDFDIGRLVGYKPLKDVYFGYLLKHRSGVFGLYSGVHGGSNYNSFYIEKNF